MFLEAPAVEYENVSARAFHQVFRLSLTIGDLAGSGSRGASGRQYLALDPR